jgi:hypothetical protein
MQSPRDDFLLEMYRQTSNHLNRHIVVLWQSVGVVAGALTVFVLGDKLGLKSDARLDFVVSIVVLLCAWLCAHVLDANNWFERNLHIITNIERQFLQATDSRDIHYYFTSHRLQRQDEIRDRGLRLPKMIAHFQIQLLLGIGIWVLVLSYHFYQRVYPGIHLSLRDLDPARAIPYFVAALCGAYCVWFASDRNKDYDKLLHRSPGKPVPELPRS